MQSKLDEIKSIYDLFDAETAVHRSKAVCTKGCAFCCMEAGRIDITTLEGLVIRETISRMPRYRRKTLKKTLMRDMKKREAGIVTPCPFLLKNKACMIYPARPFACRRVHSLRLCSKDNPPLLSRRVMVCAQKAIAALQRLDDNGYSGHIAFILYLLDTPRFREIYMAGDYKPEEIAAFGKSHRIVINKMVV